MNKINLKERYESILLSIMGDGHLNGRHYLSYERKDGSIVDITSSPMPTNEGLASFLKYEFNRAKGSVRKYICEKIDEYDLPIISEKMVYSN